MHNQIRKIEKVFPFRDKDRSIRSIVVLCAAIVLGLITAAIGTKFDLSAFLALVRLPGMVWKNIIESLMVLYVFASISLNIIDIVRSGKNVSFVLRYLLYTYIGNAFSAVLGVLIYFIFSAGFKDAPPVEFASGLLDPVFTGYADSIVQIFSRFVSPNFFQVLTTPNYSALVFYAVLFGLTINRLSFTGAESVLARCTLFFNSMVFDVALLIPTVVVGSLVYVEYSSRTIPITAITVSFILGWLLLAFVLWPLMYWFLNKSNPFKFLFMVQNSPIFAFATSSSIATIPISLQTIEAHMNVERHVRELLVPIGSILNVPGSVFYGTLASLITLKLYGDGPSFGNIMYVVIFGGVVFTGLSGVKGAAFKVAGSLVLSAGGENLLAGFVTVFLPLEFFMDSLRSALNSLADFFLIGTINNIESNVMLSMPSNLRAPIPPPISPRMDVL
ncbi:hypothetical protein RCL1_000172 [Eukaryota sp. TZLM3-RCL]